MPVLVAPEIAEQQTERDYAVFVATKEAQQIERQLLVSPDNRTINSALRKICYLTLQIAQRHVPNTPDTFSDRADLLHCIKILQEMGFKPEIAVERDAELGNINLSIIRNSFDYRQLRNKIKASLSVIADLPDKPAALGSREYQRGMREGYRRASEIAIKFLNDIE